MRCHMVYNTLFKMKQARLVRVVEGTGQQTQYYRGFESLTVLIGDYMKTRKGFVSNSSSSSFIIYKRFLSPLQIEQIRDHTKYAGENAWFIDEDELELTGRTGMDNFSMSAYLDKLGIPDSIIQWGN
jgi:hypothetical protein